MIKLFYIILSILCLFLVACKGDTPKKTISSKIQVSKSNEKVVKINSDSLSKNVVYDFYKWYINDVYLKHINDYDHAPYKKYDNNKYGLDIDEYKTNLNRVSFFSQSFKERLIEVNIKCNEAMLKADLDGFNPDYDADFSLDNNSCLCNYLWQNQWYGSQEGKNNKFEILDDFLKKEGKYTYTVQTFMYDAPFTQYEVVVIKESNLFKIESIVEVR